MMSRVIVPLLALNFGPACFFSHGSSEPSGTETHSDPPVPEPEGRTPRPAPVEPEPEHDICPAELEGDERQEAENCPCGYGQIPHPDSQGNCFLCSECSSCEVFIAEDGPLFTGGAFLSWQSPGGIAGLGRTMVITGDDSGGGLLSVWRDVPEIHPEGSPDTSPHYVQRLSYQEMNQLFLRLHNVDHSSLPHEVEIWAECYPYFYARKCDSCLATELRYHLPRQILPEFECIEEWFNTILPQEIHNPVSYCDWAE